MGNWNDQAFYFSVKSQSDTTQWMLRFVRHKEPVRDICLVGRIFSCLTTWRQAHSVVEGSAVIITLLQDEDSGRVVPDPNPEGLLRWINVDTRWDEPKQGEPPHHEQKNPNSPTAKHPSNLVVEYGH
jgi:hypothetical protein